jgi:hypothetical protein
MGMELFTSPLSEREETYVSGFAIQFMIASTMRKSTFLTILDQILKDAVLLILLEWQATTNWLYSLQSRKRGWYVDGQQKCY